MWWAEMFLKTRNSAGGRDGPCYRHVGQLQELVWEKENKKASSESKTQKENGEDSLILLSERKNKNSHCFWWCKLELLTNEEKWSNMPDNANQTSTINRADCQHTSNSWLRAATELSSLKSIRDVAKVRKKLPSEIQIIFLHWLSIQR